MLDLGILGDIKRQAVHCRTLEEARKLFFAVQEQRPDISTAAWMNPPSMPDQINRAYIFSYNGKLQLLQGSVGVVREMGYEVIPFEMLIRQFDLPEIYESQVGMLSILGL